jgi:hypothetical protein
MPFYSKFSKPAIGYSRALLAMCKDATIAVRLSSSVAWIQPSRPTQQATTHACQLYDKYSLGNPRPEYSKIWSDYAPSTAQFHIRKDYQATGHGFGIAPLYARRPRYHHQCFGLLLGLQAASFRFGRQSDQDMGYALRSASADA